jgi:hypothetical protein
MESSLAPGPRKDPFDRCRGVADKDESLPRYAVILRPLLGAVVFVSLSLAEFVLMVPADTLINQKGQ